MSKVTNGRELFCTETLLCPSSSSSYLSFHYALRYKLIRVFTCPIPFLPSYFPLIGGKSLLECIGIFGLSALAILLSLSGGSVAGSGSICQITGLVVVLTGLRNNILTIFLGISFERAIFYHRCGGMLLLAISVIHGIISKEFFGDSVTNLSGIILFLGFGATAMSYLLKKFIFELFYIAHIVLYLLITAAAFLHGAIFLGIAIIIWAIDLAFRYVITAHKVSAEAELLLGDVIRITLPRPFAYNAGQYCFLMIPSISFYQFHPFSISSAPHQTEVCFHIRVLGDWTRKLKNHIKQENLKKNSPEGNKVPIDVVIEGPLGIPKINLECPSYEFFLLVSGGIGITPTQSIYSHMYHQVNEQKTRGHIKKCLFIWSVKDRAMITGDNIIVDVEIPMTTATTPAAAWGKSSDTNVGNQTVIVSPTPAHAKTKSDTLKVKPINQDTPDLPTSFQPNLIRANINMQSSSYKAFSATELNEISKEVFECEFYLTSVRPKEDFADANINPHVQPYLNFGRPDLPAIFAQTADYCRAHGIKRVAVVTCGPVPLINDVTRLSNKCYKNVSFDLHSEVFDF